MQRPLTPLAKLAKMIATDQHRSDRTSLLARQAYLFNKKYDGPMFGTIDNKLQAALRSDTAPTTSPA